MGIIREFRDVDQLTPDDFELFVRDVFAASGWTDLHITKAGKEFAHGDGGVDIFARRSGRRFAIEVKHRTTDSTIGVSALNQLVAGAKLAGVKQMILVTNSYFTSEVRVRALRLGVELIDRDNLQTLWLQKSSEIGRLIKPRSYQQAVIDDILTKYKAGKTKFLIEMATGLGKTYTAAELTRRFLSMWHSGRPRVLCIAHQVELLLQALTSFKNVLGIGTYSYSACFDGADPEDTDFVFASFDTLYSKLPQLTPDAFHLVIVDEAHHAPASTFSQVITLLCPKVLVGLTATPYRSDGQDVRAFFGGDEGHVGRYDLVWGLANRKLAFPKYTVLLHDLTPDDIANLESGLTLSELDRRLFLHRKDDEVIQIIENTIRDKAITSPKAIVFCRSIAHMRHLLPFFPAGKATMVHGQMSQAHRRANIRQFREGDYTYILVCDLFNEGIDIPETNMLIFLRRTSSRVVWLQQLGRGLRKTANKDFVHVLDFVGSLETLAEVQQLARAVQNEAPECAEPTPEETHHDTRIEVTYNSAAAQIIPLIERMQFRLKSRQAAIDMMRRYVETHGRPPLIKDLETELDDITYDQIATHFDSYCGYLDAALGPDHDRGALRDICLSTANDFQRINGIWPSPRALSEMNRHNSLPLYTPREVVDLIGTEGPSTVAVMPEGKNGASAPPAPNVARLHNEERTALGLRYAPYINSLEELHKLRDEELREIRRVFCSDFAFLKELRQLRQRATAKADVVTK